MFAPFPTIILAPVTSAFLRMEFDDDFYLEEDKLWVISANSVHLMCETKLVYVSSPYWLLKVLSTAINPLFFSLGVYGVF